MTQSHLRHVFAALLALCAILPVAGQRLLGGDFSLLPTYGQRQVVYRDSAGRPVYFLPFVVDEGGWNAARVRLFVDPSQAPAQAKGEGVLQSLDYIIPLCKLVREQGMRLMLDFHYSDTWADPGKQFVPHRWQGAPATALADSVGAYTRATLLRLRHEGIVPDLVQVGNEVTFGMLWPTGRVDPGRDDRWDVFARLLRSGVEACRELCPKARIIIHTEHAQDWKATRGFYDRLARYGVDYDVIGLSYYPMWHGTIGHLNVVLDSLEARYPDKDLMIVETAAYYSHQNDRWTTDPDAYGQYFPISPDGQREFALELVSMLNKHPRVSGLFWWMPEENESGRPVIESWINRGLFSNATGRVLPAFYELAKFRAHDRGAFLQKPEHQYSPSTVIIWYDNSHPDVKPRLLEAIARHGCTVTYDYQNFNAVAVTMPRGMSVDDAIVLFSRVNGVLQVSRDEINTLQGRP